MFEAPEIPLAVVEYCSGCPFEEEFPHQCQMVNCIHILEGDYNEKGGLVADNAGKK